MRSINKIFEDVVKRVAEKYGSNVSFLFGDWAYISSQLTEWGKSSSTCKFKFPIICLYSRLQKIGLRLKERFLWSLS